MSEELNNKESNNQNDAVPTPSGYAKVEDNKEEVVDKEQDNLDAFGYEKEEPKVEDKKEDEKEPEDKEEEVKEPTTGYEKLEDEPKNDDEEAPKEDEKDKPEDDDGDSKKIDESLKDLPEGFDKERISKFVKDNKLTPEQVKNYIDEVKKEDAEVAERRQAALEKRKKDWTNELYNHKDFGNGDKDTYNKAHQDAGWVLENKFPELKKQLTDASDLLPPSVVIGLNRVYKDYNSKDKLVNGDPKPVENQGKNFLDDMYE